MITGFEEFTVELNDKEKIIADRIAQGLRHRIGVKNAITNKQIRLKLSKEGHRLADATIRKIVQYIRQHAIVKRVCSTSNGYFVAATDLELENWIKSMKQRARSIFYTVHCVEEAEKTQNF